MQLRKKVLIRLLKNLTDAIRSCGSLNPTAMHRLFAWYLEFTKLYVHIVLPIDDIKKNRCNTCK